MVWYWHQDTLIDQWNKTEPRNRCTHLLTTDLQRRYKGNSVKKHRKTSLYVGFLSLELLG